MSFPKMICQIVGNRQLEGNNRGRLLKLFKKHSGSSEIQSKWSSFVRVRGLKQSQVVFLVWRYYRSLNIISSRIISRRRSRRRRSIGLNLLMKDVNSLDSDRAEISEGEVTEKCPRWFKNSADLFKHSWKYCFRTQQRKPTFSVNRSLAPIGYAEPFPKRSTKRQSTARLI